MITKKIAAIARHGYVFAHKNIEDIAISGTEHAVIVHLYRQDTCNQESIAEALVFDKGTLSKALSKLEDKGYILRMVNENNRREKIVSLTGFGKDQIQKILSVGETWRNKLLYGFSEAELETFEKLLDKALINTVDMITKESEDQTCE